MVSYFMRKNRRLASSHKRASLDQSSHRAQPSGVVTSVATGRAKPASIESLESRVLLSTAAFASAVVTQISSGVFPVSATATGDLNGDGIPDLVVARDNLQAQVYFGTATGTFTLSAIYADGGNIVSLGDFNNDGKLDMATANGVYPGVGNGTFGTLLTGFTIPIGAIHLYTDDVNGDGNLDLICATYHAGTGTGTTTNPTIGMTVFLGNGDGSFKSPINSTLASAANITQADATLAFADFNNDGNLDVLSPFGVMAGNGDGTFGKLNPLPYKNLAAGAAAMPAAPIMAVGDFNGDANFDIATIPADSNTGNVEIFLGDGKGNFTDAGPITVAANQTITALDAEILGSSGSSDLLAGVSVTPSGQSGTADLAILLNSGTGTFAPATLYPLAGPPVNISTTDFNGDSNPDILSIDGIPGSTTSNGLTLAATAAVLLNSQAALVAPTLTLHTSANPAVAGDMVKYTAQVQVPTTVAAGSAVPSGTVTFFNGTTMVGAAPLVNGKAALTVTAAGVGIEPITFTYSGDGNYSGGTSSVLSQTVLETGAKVPLLLPVLNPAITIPAEFIPGDAGTATIVLTNGGGAAARGKIDVNYYLSTSGAIDASAIPLAAPTLHNRAINLGSGKSISLTAKLKLGSYSPADYFLVAQVTPVTNLTADEVSSATVLSTTTFSAAGMVFGTVGTHRNLKLKVTDASGQVATFSMTGPGSGTVTQVNGETNVAVGGTSTASRLTITSKGAFTLDNADVRNVINSFTAVRTTLAGDLNLGGGIKQLTLASASAADGQTAIRLASGALSPTLSLGNVGTLNVTAAGPIAKLAARSWVSGSVDALSIANLAVTGNFGADVRTHAGGKLQTARVGSITGGVWAIAGTIASLHVVGSIAGASIYAGADSGADDILGTGDDVFGNGTIGTLFVGGSATTTLVAAGVTPIAGGTILDGVMLLPKGSIGVITLRGAVSDDSRFLAAHLPKLVTLNGAKVATATDAHFLV